MKFFFKILFFLLILTACNQNDGKFDKQNTEEKPYAEFDSSEVLNFQIDLNDYFASENSPLIQDDREEFNGLPFYPPNPDFAVIATFEKFENPDTVRILTTKSDDIRQMTKFGIFKFSLRDTNLTLPAYRSTNEIYASNLFVPFTDLSSGKTSYSGGRYLDIPYRENTDQYSLDFNFAYNPYCAYNKKYSCPLVPPDNHLPVFVGAGMKFEKNENAH